MRFLRRSITAEAPRRSESAPRGGAGQAYRPARGRAALRLVLVAEPVDRVHDLAIGQHGGDLPADLLDVAVDGAVGHHPLVAVHRVDELIPGVDAAGMLYQHLEELELHGGEVEVRCADRRAMPRLVELHAAAFGGALTTSRAAQHRLYASDDLARTEGLADIVVGAQLQAEQAVDLLDAGRDHDDRQLARGRAQRLADLQPALARQHQVQQDQVHLVRAHPRLDLVAAVEHAHLEAVLGEVVTQQPSQLLLVLDDQHLLSHWWDRSRAEAPPGSRVRRAGSRQRPDARRDPRRWRAQSRGRAPSHR